MLSYRANYLLKNYLKISKQIFMEYLKENPFVDKYSEKIRKLKENDAATFEERLNALEKEKKKYLDPVELSKDASLPTEKSVQLKQDCLNSVVKMENFACLDQEQISELWKEFHQKKDCIFAALSVDDFAIIYDKSIEFPNFIYPLPRGGGYEFFLQRWSDRICHFTSLSDYKELKENANPCLSLIHYNELSESKGIVLMRGFPDLKKISVHESQLLALQLKMYYGRTSGLRFNLVRWFANSPTDFRHMDLVHEFENLKKDTVERREWGSPVD